MSAPDPDLTTTAGRRGAHEESDTTPDVRATTPEDTGVKVGIDTSHRTAEERRRTFMGILVNTGIANVTTSYLWFALTFWAYLQTRSVIATGVIGGAYMLLIALSSISFGTFVDRYRKLSVMRFAGAFTLVMFLIAAAVFLVIPTDTLLDLQQPWFWLFTVIILIGAVVENMRNIALSTTVTILIEPDRRANANGLVGMVQGLMFIITSVLSGVSIGFIGMGGTIVVALVLTALAFAHLLTLRMPEEVKAAASDARGGFDLRGSYLAVLAIPGLFALVLFSTFNNFVGGVYMALMDPYGLEMFSVQAWGAVFALGATGFLVGGALISKFGLGKNPLRTMLIAVVLMGVIGALFTVREWAWLYILGIWLYLILVPFIEAAEQTVIQRVVPLSRQGRVFGFAMAFESAAAPITAFVIAPIAEFMILPYARSAEGGERLAPLLGEGTSRGIALVFLVAGIVIILAALAAFLTPVYRRISASYLETAEAEGTASDVDPPNTPRVEDTAEDTADDAPSAADEGIRRRASS